MSYQESLKMPKLDQLTSKEIDHKMKNKISEHMDKEQTISKDEGASNPTLMNLL